MLQHHMSLGVSLSSAGTRGGEVAGMIMGHEYRWGYQVSRLPCLVLFVPHLGH